MHTVGLISDTHGLLRPQAMDALRGSDLIIHAGDVGNPEILDHLRAIAPTFTVRGNVDTEPWTAALPEAEAVSAGELSFWVLHNIGHLDIDPAANGFVAVIYGHSHKPVIEARNGVLFINPGSAGPRRFRLPVTVGRIVVRGRELHPEIIDLEV